MCQCYAVAYSDRQKAHIECVEVIFHGARMSTSFTKLFNSILTSTIWCEPERTRLVWISMLALADHAGRVHASIPGLASVARVPVEDCRTAIDTFLAPDRDSRTALYEGRRIEPIDGGWRLLNYTKFREMKDEESVRESKRQYMRNVRAKQKQHITINAASVKVNPQNREPQELDVRGGAQ